GDKGMTSLFSGERVSKNHDRIEACGALDELGSVLGALASALSAAVLPSAEAATTEGASRLGSEIQRVQGELLSAGAWLATTPGSASRGMLRPFGPEPTGHLEAAVERIQAALPPLEHFILAGGHPVASWAHVARAVCRRAERQALRLAVPASGPDPELANILAYLNRLSFYLFVAARYCNQLFGTPERTWQG
ncbi:MAG TPA: cob(I)yrinic acid a,c-diamide adenosyltransferase, partial [Spirochaetia bacterium]|nr:cob(I)yrinic acid a,c-diamide adenosyltransferase [Spirochaetia bacterium]